MTRDCSDDKKSDRRVSFGLPSDEEEEDTSEGTLTVSDAPANSSVSISKGIKPVPSLNTLNLLERQGFVMHKKPFRTLHYSSCEVYCMLTESSKKLWHHRYVGALLLVLGFLFYFVCRLPGQHQQVLYSLEKKLLWCAYWLILGVLSSIGFGTGLHTFLLYLGPHIAAVTLAAFECGSLMFPEPPYPDECVLMKSVCCPPKLLMNLRIICPDAMFDHNPAAMSNKSVSVNGASTLAGTLVSNMATVSIWNIMSKVRLESIMWGAGTALGELPPYFMARAGELSGQEPDDEEYREFKQFLEMTEQAQAKNDWLDAAKLSIERTIEKVGFLAILVCASIPNPLFDLAGITCGHFLVPFWKFFGSTLIGKAIIKTHIQKFFVIVAFSEQHFEKVLNWLRSVPKIGPRLEKPFRDFLNEQKIRLHRSSDVVVHTQSGIVQRVIETTVFLMIASSFISLVNSLAQRYHRRLWEEKKKQMRDKPSPDEVH
ncbi:vacuole membrane protein; transmembrane protein [Trichuris trichiura]|uniref:Vacuole membrane protein transmembrane protein n=1 Tax=Trichuris trichiura TaxID=36087 RepID=A0A077Z2A7_TRITR|nr:vacuole membrane protein; transmembrane protein [Trichuris trichiura]